VEAAVDRSDASALADLQMHWDEAYAIGLDGDIWRARFHGTSEELRAHTSTELRELIRTDYSYRRQIQAGRIDGNSIDGSSDDGGSDAPADVDDPISTTPTPMTPALVTRATATTTTMGSPGPPGPGERPVRATQSSAANACRPEQRPGARRSLP
jgi:hypothetical protein